MLDERILTLARRTAGPQLAELDSPTFERIDVLLL